MFNKHATLALTLAILSAEAVIHTSVHAETSTSQAPIELTGKQLLNTHQNKLATKAAPVQVANTGNIVAQNVEPTLTETVGIKPALDKVPEVALASYLKQSGAKMYGSYTCPFSNLQRQLFGTEASSHIPYIECNARGKNAQPNLCQTAKILSTPTWEINGKLYRGVRSLEQLARLSGYRGSLAFEHSNSKN